VNAGTTSRIPFVNIAKSQPAKFVLAFFAVIAIGLVLYLGAAAHVYLIAGVVWLIQALFG
jgi:hypothetical protein